MKYREILKLKWPKVPVLKFIDDTYGGIVWHPLLPHPSKAELDDAIAQYAQASIPISMEGMSAVLPETGVTPGTYARVTVDATGRITGGTLLSQQDVVDALGFIPSNHANLVDLASAYVGSTGQLSGTSIIPADTTQPLITEGTQLWSQVVTPNSANSKYLITQAFMLDSSVNNRQITLALFRDSTCVYANSVNVGATGRTVSAFVHSIDVPATADPITYSLRIGINASTWYVNRSATNSITFGGIANSSDWSILELA